MASRKEKKLANCVQTAIIFLLLSLNVLQVYQQAFETFNGLLLKLAITCGNEEHCLLLKFKSTVSVYLLVYLFIIFHLLSECFTIDALH